jgi:hypothetical protein
MNLSEKQSGHVGPAAAHACQHKGKGICRELSRRDSAKVAQYEVLGWRFNKRRVPDGRDDRRLTHKAAYERPELFDRPLRDGHVFCNHFPALRTGLLSPSPSGTTRGIYPFPNVDAHGRSPD